MPNEWVEVETRLPPEREEVDVWMYITPSPRSFGWGDRFRLIEVWRVGDKWFHRHEGAEKELYADYVTHWMPMPKPPNGLPRSSVG